MKVDPRAAAAQVVKAQPFKQLLAEAKAELKKDPRPALPVVAKPAAVAKSVTATAPKPAAAAPRTTVAQTQQRARVHVEAEAQRLGTVRSEHARTADALTHTRAQQTEAVVERSHARLLDFITRELSQEPTPTEPRLAVGHHLQPAALVAPTAAPPRVEAAPEAKAAQAVALIEKIEVFVRSQRPGLALTLNNSLGAHVEIERIGPKEIALKLVGHRGPPTAEADSRIREELRARGLKVGALSVA